MFGFLGAGEKARALLHTMPVADITGSRPGATLYVTAGLDGDEHVGIEAAYRATEKYKDGDFAGRLIIMPLVNIPGFEAGVSYNPLDKKFPKHCITGRAYGSVTQRTMYALTQTYARHADLWLDLHSGALNEVAIPCLWNDITGVQDVDAKGEAFVHASGVVAAVRGRAYGSTKKLAQFGCTYVLVESEDVAQQSSYIERAMQQLGMTPRTPPTSTKTRIFSKTRAVYAPSRGIWDPEEYVQGMSHNEVLLWHKTAGTLSPNEQVGEIAYQEITE